MDSRGKKRAATTQGKFQPAVKWIHDDPSKHVLRIELPGFEKEHLRVEVDNSGKLMVKGKKQIGSVNYFLDEVFDVPEDSSVEETTGTFADGLLTLSMPKMKKEAKDAPAKTTPPSESTPSFEKKEAAPEKQALEKTTTADKKEAMLEKQDPAADKTKAASEKEASERTTPTKKKETTTKPIRSDEEEEEGKGSKVKRRRTDGDGYRKEEQRWLDFGKVDCLLEKISSNRKVIAVAVVAFSVGFYVSHRLRIAGK